MISTDFEKYGFFAKGHVHATNELQSFAACGLPVRWRKVQVMNGFFGTNCPACRAKLLGLRADEEARGLHKIVPKAPHEQTALIIFCLEQALTQDFVMTPDRAVGITKGSFGTDESIHYTIRAFERSLGSVDTQRPRPEVLAAKFLGFVASHQREGEPGDIEWSICRRFDPSGANPYDTTYWMTFDPTGVKPPRYTYQGG